MNRWIHTSRSFIFICILFLCQDIHAQITSIDIVGGPSYSYRILDSSRGDDIWERIIGENSDNRAKINYIAGFNIYLNASEKMDFKIGARYVEKGYHTRRSLGFTPSTRNTRFFTNSYIEVPLMIRGYIRQEKDLYSFIELGFAPAYLINQTITSVEFGEKNTEPSTLDYPKIDNPFILSFGSDFQYNNVIFFGQVLSKLSIPGFETVFGDREQFFEIALEFGIRYSFNPEERRRENTP